MQLAQAPIVAELRGLDAMAVVFDGAVAPRVVDGHVDLGRGGVERVFHEATDDRVERGDDHRRLDLRHDMPWQWLDGHGGLTMTLERLGSSWLVLLQLLSTAAQQKSKAAK